MLDYHTFLESLSAPARSALLHEGIDTFEKLASYSQKDILKLHGIGKASIPIISKALAQGGYPFPD